MTESRYDVGMKVRKEVLGSEYVERALAGSTEFDADFPSNISLSQPGVPSGRVLTWIGEREAWSRLRFWQH